MAHYTVIVSLGAYADGTFSQAIVSLGITSETGAREYRQIEVPLEEDGPIDSPEDLLRALIPHVVEYI